MQDTELYQQLLGLTVPWTVDRVDLSIKDQKVDVWVQHSQKQRWPCPECGEELSLYDHSDERTWRHLDSCQFKTFLHARPPRVKCPTHAPHRWVARCRPGRGRCDAGIHRRLHCQPMPPS